MSIYIALICMVVIFERTASARKIGVTKNPMDMADTVKDFIWLDAWNTRIAITNAKFLNPASTIPAKKQRRLSKKNVFLATAVFDKSSDIGLRMDNIPKMQVGAQQL